MPKKLTTTACFINNSKCRRRTTTKTASNTFKTINFTLTF